MCNKNFKSLVGALAVAVFFVGMIGCSGSSGSTNPAEGNGFLQVAFVAPNDVAQIVVSLHLGTDATGPLVEARALAGDTLATLFENIHADNYYVVAQAKDSGGVVIYNGAGGMYVLRDVTNVLHILLNQSSTGTQRNAAPKIDAVAVIGRTVAIGEVVADAGPGSELDGLYVAAPDENEPITFVAQVSDHDADPLDITMCIRTLPNSCGLPEGIFGAGTTTPVGDNGITWEHDVEGTYYVIVSVSDPSGSSANFNFPVYVWRGEGDLQVNFEFNTYPTIAVDVTVTEANMPDLSDVNIFLEPASSDPDGNQIVSTTWTEDCAYANLITDPTSLNAMLAPTVAEVCNVTQTACDSRGCNEVVIELNIECATLGNGFDPEVFNAEPFNECFLEAVMLYSDVTTCRWPGHCLDFPWSYEYQWDDAAVIQGYCDTIATTYEGSAISPAVTSGNGCLDEFKNDLSATRCLTSFLDAPTGAGELPSAYFWYGVSQSDCESETAGVHGTTWEDNSALTFGMSYEDLIECIPEVDDSNIISIRFVSIAGTGFFQCNDFYESMGWTETTALDSLTGLIAGDYTIETGNSCQNQYGNDPTMDVCFVPGDGNLGYGPGLDVIHYAPMGEWASANAGGLGRHWQSVICYHIQGTIYGYDEDFCGSQWPFAPSCLSYSSPVIYNQGTTILDNSPSVNGTVDSYSVIPALPLGLSINTSSGVISGTPTTVTAEAVYTVTAVNAVGSDTFDISIQVDYPAEYAQVTTCRWLGHCLDFPWSYEYQWDDTAIVQGYCDTIATAYEGAPTTPTVTTGDSCQFEDLFDPTATRCLTSFLDNPNGSGQLASAYYWYGVPQADCESATAGVHGTTWEDNSTAAFPTVYEDLTRCDPAVDDSGIKSIRYLISYGFNMCIDYYESDGWDDALIMAHIAIGALGHPDPANAVIETNNSCINEYGEDQTLDICATGDLGGGEGPAYLYGPMGAWASYNAGGLGRKWGGIICSFFGTGWFGYADDVCSGVPW